MHKNRISVGQFIISLGIAVVAVGLVAEAEAISQGIQAGLSACGGTLIPALFPFMTLSGFLSLSDYGRAMSYPLQPLVRKIYRLPGELAPIVLLGLIGGYPVGARSIATLLEQGRLERKTAERMLCFCVNCGPSFLITAVGVKMLSDRRGGLILFFTQTAATLIVGIIVSFRAENEPELLPVKKQNCADTFVRAVSGACYAMINMCAFAVLFSGLLPVINRLGVDHRIAYRTGWDPALIRAAINGFFEVTGGCMAAAGIAGVKGYFLLSLIVSFGGISVIFQIASCFKDKEISLLPFLCTRPLHMALSSSMAMPLYRKYCATSAAWAATPVPVQNTDLASLTGSLCLIGMCIILILATQESPKNRCSDNKWRTKCTRSYKFSKYEIN